MGLTDIRRALAAAARPERVAFLQRYFKTGPGEYGEGDRLIGAYVGDCRAVARKHRNSPLEDVERLLASSVHEERLVALLILVQQFERGDASLRRRIYDLYLSQTQRVNNWDLVDASAPQIVGAFHAGQNKEPLMVLARSQLLWERRIAIMATYHDIKAGSFDATLAVAEVLLHDPHDLIHKAVGWMLREVGKRDADVLRRFLDRFAESMPRTMLRYAVEKMPRLERERYRQMSRSARDEAS